LKRLSAIHTDAFVAGIANELDEARKAGSEEWAAEIHARFTYRMQNLSVFKWRSVNPGQARQPPRVLKPYLNASRTTFAFWWKSE
jgi:hypothetical protein